MAHAIAGRLETVQSEVPVHRVLQFRLSNAAGDAHHPAQSDRVPDSDYQSIDRGFRGLAVVIPLLG